jgi:general nucleoside transport system permease protein
VSSTSRRPSTRRILRALTPGRLRLLFAAAGALLVFDLVAFAFGEAPLAMLMQAFAGTWGTGYGTGQVLFKATPLLLTGLAFHVALRAGLFNIGAEGQLALAALAAGWVGTRIGDLHWLVALPIVLVTAMAVGAGYAAIAGVMRARLGVHEIISTIMLNRCADVLLPWILVAGLGAISLRTDDLPPGARLPGLERWHWISGLSGSAASLAFPMAVAIAFACYHWLDRSRPGREMRWVGLAPSACEAQGIDVARRRIEAMVLSGALAGLVCMGTVLGYKGYYELGLGAGAGFSGIAVAMVGRKGPLQLVIAALVFGTLAQAGLAINAQVPKEAMGVIEAVVILLVAAAAGAGPEAERAEERAAEEAPA